MNQKNKECEHQSSSNWSEEFVHGWFESEETTTEAPSWVSFESLSQVFNNLQLRLENLKDSCDMSLSHTCEYRKFLKSLINRHQTSSTSHQKSLSHFCAEQRTMTMMKQNWKISSEIFWQHNVFLMSLNTNSLLWHD